MRTKKASILFAIIILAFKVWGQQAQPYPNTLLTPVYTRPVTTQTTTATPVTPYTNHVPGSSAPYTYPDLPQQTAPPPPANPPPSTPPNSMVAPTITEPAQQPIPPPPPQ